MRAPISHDAAMIALAGRQNGNVTRAQLLHVGLSAKAITHRTPAAEDGAFPRALGVRGPRARMM